MQKQQPTYHWDKPVMVPTWNSPLIAQHCSIWKQWTWEKWVHRDEEGTHRRHIMFFFFSQIKKINIGHDGKGADQQWFLKSITIEKKDEVYK